MRKLVLFLVSLLFAAENAAAQVPDIGQKKDRPQLSLTDTVKNIDRGAETETKPEDEEDKGIFSFMNFSFSKKKESKKVYARPDEKKESFVQRITRQAEEGDVNAQLTLGYMYLYGEEGVEIDYDKAFRYYSMAAAQKDNVAINNLGSLYYSGIGTEKDYLKAATLFDEAAKLGNVEASVNLAFIYLSGSNVGKTAAPPWNCLRRLPARAIRPPSLCSAMPIIKGSFTRRTTAKRSNSSVRRPMPNIRKRSTFWRKCI